MTKNSGQLILAVLFMFGFLFFWETFVASRYNVKAPAPAAVAKTDMPATAVSPATTAVPVSTNGSAPVGTEDVLTVLGNADTKVSFLSRGARVASWQVKERDHWLELLEPEKSRVVSPLETFPTTNFAVEKKSEKQVVFTATLDNGVVLTKTVTLFDQPPFHSITLNFSNPTGKDLAVDAALPWGNGLSKHVVGKPYDESEQEVVVAETRVVGLTGETVKSWKPGFIFGRTVDFVDPSSYQWAGVDTNHFLAAFIADSSKIEGLHAVCDRTHAPLLILPIKATVKAGGSASYSYKMYVGAKSHNYLKALPYNLDKAVDFGFFGYIAKILLAMLIFFERMTGNYGWAIVMLTFCIQLLVFPLTRKNLQMSIKMRTLQPQLKKIQEAYKKDPKRLQIETFNLYRKNGMKFMGMEGCFPMLLQLPIFFAYYSTLNVAYELRGAPWIFWIRDLGVYDPYYVLPIVMGLGMLVQQKLTTFAMDPAQARIMMFMPLIFSFMFIHLPAGLVLYWCVNSLVTIAIQLVLGIHKQPKTPELEVVR